jgi:prolyl-tRNA synthetase
MSRKTAVTPTRAQNYPEWYQQVIRAADMAENSSVRGCMIIKPWGYGIWERLQQQLDRRFKETGHQNCYFPLFIPMSLIATEAAHVEGFAKEMAVVTHHRLVKDGDRLRPDAELEEPLVVRPTSEMIIGQAMADWIQSYRDLPMLLNQWANVVRWEMRPRLFLRTSEFLWQEGHTAHATAEEAMEETRRMLEIYRQVVEDVMAVPVIPGEKSESERFPGADRTLTIEAMMQDGRALQAGTSHFLGQNFAKAVNMRYQDREGGLQYCWTTSWGVSTRLIGAMIMAHGDDNGLRLPPMLAPHQVVIVPIIRSPDQRGTVLEAANRLAARIREQSWKDAGIRCHVDEREIPAPDKRWEWIKKGVPVVCELGPLDIEKGVATFTMRNGLDEGRVSVPLDEFAGSLPERLQATHDGLYNDVLAYRQAKTATDLKTFEEFREYFGKDNASSDSNRGFARAKWSGNPESEEKLKELGVTIRCLPFDQSETEGRCILTGEPATTDAIFARAY